MKKEKTTLSFYEHYRDGTTSFGITVALLISLMVTLGGFFFICLGLRAFSCTKHRKEALPYVFLGCIMIVGSWWFFVINQTQKVVAFSSGVFASVGILTYIALRK